MQREAPAARKKASRELHPVIYKGIIALALWLMASIWSLARSSEADFVLVVVSGFIFFTVLVPATLWWTWRRHQPRSGDGEGEEPFQSWISRPFEMWQGRTSGADAAVEILLPIAAVAFGMTALALVQHFVV